MAAGIPPGTAKSGTGDITGVTAGDGLSGGGTDGGVTVTLDLNELTAAAVADGDFIPIIDTNDSNGSRKEAVADLATLFAGDGLTASSSVLAVNVDDSTIETSSDAIRIKDNGVSLAKMAGLTRGSMIIGNASGDPAELTKGSANYVLTSDGTDIAWAAASGAAVTALNNATANEIVTVGSTTTELDAESTLTFASNKLIPTATAHNAAGTALTMSAGATTAGTTNNIAGGALTFQGGQGKGSGAGGSIVFQTANAAGSGSSLNALATALTLEDDLNATFGNDVLLNTDSAVIKMGADDDVTLTHDGTTGLTVAANPFEVDSGGNITLDAHTGIFIFQDANTEVLRITEGNSGDVTVKLVTNAKDLIFTDNGDATGLTVKDAAAGIVVPGEVMTTKISYTDGDDAMTIADGGGVSFTQIDDAHLDSSPTDETVSGITATFTAGEALERGEVVYFKQADSKMWKAVATAAATSNCVAMAAADISADAAGKFLLQGFCTDNGTFPDYSASSGVGKVVYTPEAETSSQNVPEKAAPDTDGDFVQIIGYVVSANTLYFNPNSTIVEVA